MKNKLTVSDNFTALMISFEREVLTGYLDPVGIPTIGIGHFIRKGEPYKVGRAITREESRKLFKKDTAWAVDAVNRLVTRPINQNQFDALVSLVFNIGEKAFARSTVLRETNRGNFAAAAKAFGLWNKARGRVLKGLVRRRKAEAELFLTPAANHSAQKSKNRASMPSVSDDSQNSVAAATEDFEPQTIKNDSDAPIKPDNPVKTIEAPPSDGSTATATKLTIAGLTLPPALAALVKIIQDAVAGGFVDAKTIGDSVISFLSINYKYVFVGIGILITFLTIKKLFKQITLWLEMFFAASRDYNDVKIKKG
jgi:lysozyme